MAAAPAGISEDHLHTRRSCDLQLPVMREHHHCDLEGHRIIEFTDIQPDQLLKTLQPVHKRIPVQKQPPSRLRDIQVVLEKQPDRDLHLLINFLIRQMLTKYLVQE